jgi:hypothetical protein
MKECRWLKPTTVAEIEFAEWTPDDSAPARLVHRVAAGKAGT